MRLTELFAGTAPVFSFEFFLPKTTDDMARFKRMVGRLQALEPSFVTITYGAGGSERGRTIETAGMIQRELGIETAAHLTCIGHTRSEIEDILRRIGDYGIENIVALRGDQPKDAAAVSAAGRELPYARDLVEIIRARRGFAVAVAGYPETHPEAADAATDLAHLKAKVDAGADWIITQLFFRNADYFSFVERARAAGITCPIVPGIMPVTSFAQTKRFSEMCGATLPDEMTEALSRIAEDKEAIVRYGVEYATRQCRELLEKGAPGVHFYTINKSRSTADILSRLRKA
ncbi:MAG: methylenetetrahydrofolate reductase [NAD(P)H] [Elusimicrobiota bacterium]